MLILLAVEHGRVKVDAANYYSIPLLHLLLLNLRLDLIYVAQVELLSQSNILQLSEHSLVNHGGILILNKLTWGRFVDLGLSDLVNLLHLELLDPEELGDGQNSVASKHFVATAYIGRFRNGQAWWRIAGLSLFDYLDYECQIVDKYGLHWDVDKEVALLVLLCTDRLLVLVDRSHREGTTVFMEQSQLELVSLG